GHSAWIYAKAVVAQHLIGAAWDRAKAGDVVSKPWWWADTYPVARLTLGGRQPSRAEEPEPTTLKVLDGSSGRNLAFGPSHDAASVMPGEPGNSVIEGHRDTHFSVLKNLEAGDFILVERAGGHRESFVVTDLRVADSRRFRIALDSDTPRLTLVTCYPF